MDGVVPAGEGLLRSGGGEGGSGRVSGPASTCVWAVGMAQTQGTVPVGGQRRCSSGSGRAWPISGGSPPSLT